LDVDERLRLRPREDRAPDWVDVTARARARRRRRLRRRVGAGLVLAAIALVPTALALRGVVEVDFGASPRGPAPVVRQFETFDIGWPAGMRGTGVIPEQTRKVAEIRRGGVHRILWVAPTTRGGFCWILEFVVPQAPERPMGSGGCGIRYGGRMHAGVETWESTMTVIGRVRDRSIARLTIRYSDGTTESPTIHWVSEPIGVGFFAHPVTRADRRRPVEVIAEDASGKVVKTEALR
jgi:hypothetical protein